MFVGCATKDPELGSLNLHQPPTIHLKGGTPIQTVEGVYTPPKDEIWHSDARYRQLERKVFNQ